MNASCYYYYYILPCSTFSIENYQTGGTYISDCLTLFKDIGLVTITLETYYLPSFP